MKREKAIGNLQFARIAGFRVFLLIANSDLPIVYCLLLRASGAVLFLRYSGITLSGLRYRSFTKPVTEGGRNISIIPPVEYLHIYIAVHGAPFELLPVEGVAHI